MTLDTHVRLVAHGAVHRLSRSTNLVLPHLKLKSVVARLEFELLGMARETIFGRDFATTRMGQTVTAIARQHVGPTYLLYAVTELLVAHGALEVLLKMRRVFKDHRAWQEVIDIRVAVEALSHRRRPIGIDHDRRSFELVGQNAQIRIGHGADVETKLVVTLIAIDGRIVTERALVHVAASTGSMGLLGPILTVRAGAKVERGGVTVLAVSGGEFAVGAVRDAVAVEARLHGGSEGNAGLMCGAIVTRVAAHHEVVTVAEHDSRGIGRTDLQVTRRAGRGLNIPGEIDRIRGDTANRLRRSEKKGDGHDERDRHPPRDNSDISSP